MTTTTIAGRFRALADTLTRNAAVLSAAGLPETVVATRVTVYRDVAAQVRLVAEAELDQGEGNPLVVALPERDIELLVTRRFEQLAGLLVANARTLTAHTADPEMRRRAAVYRDVAAQVRLWALPEVEQAAVRARRVRRLVRHGQHAGIAVQASQFCLDASTGLPVVRPAFMEPLVDAIAKRFRAGWSVARLTRWLRSCLTDPQTGEVYVLASRTFIAYVTGLLTGAHTTSIAA